MIDSNLDGVVISAVENLTGPIQTPNEISGYQSVINMVLPT